jgi:hypothetical protein
MKHLLLVVGLISSLGVQAQLTSISVETFQVHDGTIISELAGFTTYHVYANTSNSTDFVSSVFGDSENELIFSSTGTVFQSTPSFTFGNQPNSALFGVLPILEFDSWLTIGMMTASDNGGLSNVGMDVAMNSFDTTGDFYIDDPIGGAWFYPGFPCGITPVEECSSNFDAFGGEDNKVLLAQITTDGSFTGVFNVQVFVGGVQNNSANYTGVGFSTDPNDVFGCVDPTADNYDPSATVDDFSCTLPCSLTLVVDSLYSPTCYGDNDGSLFISSTGAQGADDYYLGVADTIPSNYGYFNNLVAGDYYVEVVDGVGCMSSATVTVPVTESVTLTATLTEAISCFGMSDATIEVSNAMGGSGSLEFYLLGSPETVSSSTVFSDLGPGTYSVVAIDENGCSGISFASFVNNPTEVHVQILLSSDATCSDIADGVITCGAWGGAAPATITYTVDGVSGLTSPISVTAGTYSVVATDVNGCIANSDEYDNSPVVIGPDVIDINASSNPVACTDDANGSISWAPVGGVGNFTVVVDTTDVTGSTMMDLAPGIYNITVTDGNGCTNNEDVEVMNAAPIVTASESTAVSCNGLSDGQVVVSATGGTGSFQYSENGNTFVNVDEFEGLSVGNYTFYAQDENGCVAEVDASVAEPDAIVITGIASEGEDTGNAEINISVTGGTPGYSYEWTGPGVDGITSADLENLSTGTYIVEVTDSAGCSMSTTFNVVTSLYELEGGVEAKVYPNPSTGLFNISWTGFAEGYVDFTVIDARGRLVTSGVWLAADSSFETVLDLNGLDNGLYRLSVIANGIPASIQLVKAN